MKWLTAMVLIAVLGAETSALAQKKKAAPAAKPAAAKSTTPTGKGGQRRVIQLEGLKVEGRIQKPEAMLVFNRSRYKHDVAEKTESFSDKIVESLSDDAF